MKNTQNIYKYKIILEEKGQIKCHNQDLDQEARKEFRRRCLEAQLGRLMKTEKQAFINALLAVQNLKAFPGLAQPKPSTLQRPRKDLKGLLAGSFVQAALGKGLKQKQD